ncbi:MAG: hypothetical protein HQK60_07625 [Deltaproteobacteria bacterium]|nr:hypothetical protein [Deltaproteobacteria bacterium]
MKIFRLGISLLAVTSLLCLSLSINYTRCYAAESPAPVAAPDSNKAVSPPSVPTGTGVKTPATVAPTKSAETPAKVDVNPAGKEAPKSKTNSAPADKTAAPEASKNKGSTPAVGSPDNSGTTGPTRQMDTLKPKPLNVLPEPYVFSKEQTIKQAPTGGKLPAKDEKELLARAKKYWQFRKDGDNKQAYEMEHPKFRSKFKLQGYLPAGGSGVEYKSIKVLSAEKKLNEPGRGLVRVEINSVIYGIPGATVPNRITMADTWEKDKGKWYHILYVGLFADHDPTKDDSEKGVKPMDHTKDTMARPASPMGPPPKPPIPSNVPAGEVSKPPVVPTPPPPPLLLPQIKGIPGEGAQKGQAPASPMPVKETPKSPGPGMQMSPGSPPPSGPGMQMEKAGSRPSVPGMEMPPGSPPPSGPGMQMEKGTRPSVPGMEMPPGSPPPSGPGMQMEKGSKPVVPGMQAPANNAPGATSLPTPVKDAPAKQ